jgi:hypothetical protein
MAKAGKRTLHWRASTPLGPKRNGSARRRLHLRAQEAGSMQEIVARVSPCAGIAGSEVQLNRGGKRLAVKRLDRGCAAHFFTRVDGDLPGAAAQHDDQIKAACG